MISKSGSIEGWDFKVWFKRNWKQIKPIVKFAASYGIAYLVLQDPVWAVPLTGLIKLAMDTLEFWMSDVKV